MKLIIDIEDEALERLSTVDPNLLYSAIKNGKPYEGTTSGDLISREALKKTIKDSDIIHCFANLWYADILKEIDNAPTVTPEITNEDIQNAIKQGYNDGFAMAKATLAKEAREIADENYKYGYEKGKAENERPQGEWIDPQDCFCYQCSNCGEYTNNEGTVKEGLFDFCPKCGADMRGGAE